MNETVRLVGVLTCIAIIVGLLVSLAESITREPIRAAKIAAEQAAAREVLPMSEAEPEGLDFVAASGATNRIFRAGDAVAVRVAVQGYGGPVSLLVGFTEDGRLFNYSVLEHQETPGLGARIGDASFREGVTKNADGESRPVDTTNWKVRKDGGDIDAIAGATISSRAVCAAVQAAAAIRSEYLSSPSISSGAANEN